MGYRFGAQPLITGATTSSSSGPIRVQTRKREKKSFRIGGDPFTPEEMRKWMSGHVARENLAETQHDKVAQQALSHVLNMMRWHEERTQDQRDKWQVLNMILRGESLSGINVHGDIHVAELHKNLERIVPAIVEVLLNGPDWFVIEGRDGRDRRRVRGITEWMRFQWDANHFESEVEAWVRAFLVYQFAAWKVYWDFEFTDVVNRYYTDGEPGEDGSHTLEVECRDETILTYEGNRVKLVDPLTFIFDPTATRVQDMEFVGDWCDMSEVELRRHAENGLFAADQIEAVIASQPMIGTPQESDWQRDLRSLTSTFDLDRTRRSPNQPNKYRVVELWAMYRPTPESEFHRYKMVVVNGTHLVELRRNPHDGQHVPYAIARSAKEPFDFLNVGTFDHAIPLQIEMDNHRRLAMQAHLNAVAPPVFLPTTADDTPMYLWQIEPGRIYRSDAPPQPLKLPTTFGEMVAMEELMRRDIADITGAPPMFDGGAGGSATNTEALRQEGNRRIRQLVVRFADGMLDAMKIMLANTRQFVTPQHAMRVLNGDFLSLRLREAMRPETFAVPVDIKMRGPKGLQQHGLRPTLFVQWLTQMGPLLPQAIQNGNLSVEELISEAYEAMLGQRLDDRVLRRPRPRDEMLRPEVENVIFEQGGHPEVHPDDPDEEHIEVHRDAVESGRFTAEEVAVVMEHLLQHEQQSASKSARQRAMQAPQSPVFQPGQSAMNPRASDAKGRYDQPADLMGQARAGSVPGETPGPANASRMAAMDREQPVPQEYNRP